MKKMLIITAALIAIAANATAQIDTLWVGDRVPNYYYWDTNWWDHYYLNYTPLNPNDSLGHNHISFGCAGGMGAWESSCKVERARYFYTDTAMRIIGVAAMIYITDNAPATDLNYNEYFRLYEVGIEGMEDSMVFITEASWNNNPVSHYMQAEALWCPHIFVDTITCEVTTLYYEDVSFYPVYEAYFDSAVWVTDSFYLSGTKNNAFNDWEYHTGGLFNEGYTIKVPNRPCAYIRGPGAGQPETDSLEIWLKPQNHRYKAHYIGHPYNVEFEDTLWHFYKIKSFSAIFPIFDTCPRCEPPVLPPDSCPVPQGLRASVSQYVAGDATLMWNNNSNAVSWEVAICPEGCLPDEGNILASATTFIGIEGLDTAQWYTAWARSVCDSGRISEWSDSTRFYTPGSNQQGNEDITTVTDRYTSIYPNPASNTVNILSSFRLKSVEIFDLNGKLLVDRKIGNSIKTTLHIADLDAGTYMVRINTENGTTYKKLIVK